MNIQQLRHFIALAEKGSFTRAAEHISLTQPALSRSIGQFEAELGMKLVDRIGKRCEVTAFGHVVLEHARRVIFETEELYRVVKQQHEGSAGRIRIGLGSTPSALLTAPLLSRFSTTNPSLHILLMRGSIPLQVQALRDRTLDMLVVEIKGVPVTADLSIELLPELRAGFLANSEHPLAKRENVSFSDLGPWPLATTMLAPEQIRNMVAMYGPQAHPDESVTFHSDAIDGLLQTVLHSETVYYGVLAPAHELMDSGQLVEVPIKPVSHRSQFGIVRLSGRSQPPMFPTLKKIISEKMEEWSRI
ncbi:LysR family transcriptional regulator [Ochrobactrum chromiisoli]|uniref:LysR family transcriptional regulator n=1 Tax=Ochrobactrum chromiisoli TaxID=2993941 RepID=A0ABT3QTL6_9HYPH|nr:LysR family transcriptional regulator [Ochrobactrum chromiisoli]MCX2698965.1 LysR family transcriptional regulator [Ochrobactrum chromiisoli]